MADVKKGLDLVNDLVDLADEVNESDKGKLTCDQIGGCLDKHGLGHHKEEVLRSAANILKPPPPPPPKRKKRKSGGGGNIIDMVEHVSVGDVVKVITGLGGLFF